MKWGLVFGGLLLVAACDGGSPVVGTADATTPAPTAPTTAPTTARPAPAPPPSTAAITTLPTVPAPPAPPAGPTVRSVTEQSWLPMSSTGPVTLVHPSSHVERVGFHESNHDGAQQQDPAPTATNPAILEGRDRGTGSQTAADVVVDPAEPIRAPVTGRVIRGGTYTLYCDHTDEYAVIEPDARPGWEVKVLHVVGLQVAVGDRVVAGETTLALAPRQLPFASQVDDLRSAEPAWPHVHIEVVDPSIPDRPGEGCP